MIQYGNIQQDAAIPDLPDDLVVGFDWLEVAAGMIVTQDDARTPAGYAGKILE